MLDSCRALEGEGFQVTYLPVQTNGIINMEDLEKALTPETSLVSIMTVNNEIGEFSFIFLSNIFEIIFLDDKNEIFHCQKNKKIGGHHFVV